MEIAGAVRARQHGRVCWQGLCVNSILGFGGALRASWFSASFPCLSVCVMLTVKNSGFTTSLSLKIGMWGKIIGYIPSKCLLFNEWEDKIEAQTWFSVNNYHCAVNSLVVIRLCTHHLQKWWETGRFEMLSYNMGIHISVWESRW